MDPHPKPELIAHPSGTDAVSAGVPAEHAEALALAKGSPRWEAMLARRQRIAARGLLEFAVVDVSLPDDALYIVRLGQSGPLKRYVVASRDKFNDEVFSSSLLQAHVYESRHEEDTSPVSITAYPGGRIVIDSTELGVSEYLDRSSGRWADGDRTTRAMLAQASPDEKVAIPGFGSAAVVRLVDRG